MRIRTNIFIWVFFATVLPLTALTLAATYYTEFSHREDARQKIHANLENVAASLSRQQQEYRDLSVGISHAPAVQAYLPVLRAAMAGEPARDAERRRQAVNTYFEGFQPIIPGVFILRILDADGNSMVMVNNTRKAAAIYESLTGIDYVEQEIPVPDFVETLKKLPRDEVSTLRLPQNENRSFNGYSLMLEDMVVPLYLDDRFVGAVSLTLLGDELDRILNHTPRLFDGHLMLIEVNAENTENGRLLYDKQSGLYFARPRAEERILPMALLTRITEQVDDGGSGMLDLGDDTQLYFTAMSPYPIQFTNWVVASEVSKRAISAPFMTIRLGIMLVALAALFFSLALMMFGSRRIARPMCQLARDIKTFADGRHDLRVETRLSIDELRALATSFNYLADTLQATESERDRAQQMVLQSNKLASIGQMAAGIGHEINNPLNNILSYTKLIARNLGNPQASAQLEDDLQALRDETLRASQIVKGILNFARQVTPHYRHFEIAPWLEHTVSLVQQATVKKQIHIELDNHCTGEAEGDRQQLQQALVNLLINAIHASPESGHIRIEAQCSEQQLTIRICDQGPGIDEADLPNIFDPFFTTKPEGEGSGLGLSISLGIIERHQGKLVIINTPQGLCATMTLPRYAIKYEASHAESVP